MSRTTSSTRFESGFTDQRPVSRNQARLLLPSSGPESPASRRSRACGSRSTARSTGVARMTKLGCLRITVFRIRRGAPPRGSHSTYLAASVTEHESSSTREVRRIIRIMGRVYVTRHNAASKTPVAAYAIPVSCGPTTDDRPQRQTAGLFSGALQPDADQVERLRAQEQRQLQPLRLVDGFLQLLRYCLQRGLAV